MDFERNALFRSVPLLVNLGISQLFANVTGEAVLDLEARRPSPLTLTIYTSVNRVQDGRITPIPYALHALDQMDSTYPSVSSSPFFDL